jgi:branched-chain amino acid transport system substrate-binding protein
MAVATAALMLSTSACGSSDSDEKALAWVGPLTGESANLGKNSLNGAKLAIDEANKNGGTKIKLLSFDSQGDPAQATTIKDRYIHDKNVIGVVGPTFSGETKAILPDLQSNGLVMVSPSATNVLLPTIVPNETVFHRIMADDDAQGKALAGYLTKVLKAKKIAYIHDNSDYGRGLAEGTKKLTEAAGAKTVLTDVIEPKGQDYSSAVNKVKAAAPDVVMYGGYYTDAGHLRKQLVDANVKVPFLGGDGSFDPGFIDAGGANADGATISCPCNLATPESAGALGDFARNYKTLNGSDPGTYSTEGYDAAKILIKGIQDGKVTRPALLDYVEHVGTQDGLSKQITFEDNGNVKSTAIFFFTVKSGKFTLVGNSEDLLK